MGIYRFFEIFVAPEQFLCYYMRCKFRELINAQIAQLVEQRTENPRVAGSIPALGILLGELGNKYGALAQLVEHLTFNQVVRGSNPRCFTLKLL